MKNAGNVDLSKLNAILLAFRYSATSSEKRYSALQKASVSVKRKYVSTHTSHFANLLYSIEKPKIIEKKDGYIIKVPVPEDFYDYFRNSFFWDKIFAHCKFNIKKMIFYSTSTELEIEGAQLFRAYPRNIDHLDFVRVKPKKPYVLKYEKKKPVSFLDQEFFVGGVCMSIGMVLQIYVVL